MISRLIQPRRAAGPPVPFVADATTDWYGNGASAQIEHEVLLRETLSIASACVDLVANRMSSLELEVVIDREREPGTVATETLDDHQLKMLLDRPHPNWTIANLLRLSAQWIMVTGEAYWFKIQGESGGLGVPLRLQPYPPWQVEPLTMAGEIVEYRVTDGNGRQFLKPANQVIRAFFPDPANPWRARGYVGPSVIGLDAYKFMSQHIRAHYQYDATPKVVLFGDIAAKMPEADQRRRVNRRWFDSYNRSAGSRRGVPRWLMPGWQAKELSGAAPEATKAFLDFYRESLMMEIGGVPPALLGRVVSGDRSSAETVQWLFDRGTISAIARLLEDALTLQLASDYDSPVRVRFAPFVSEDKEFELKKEAQDLEHAIRTPNQVLLDREMDPVPWGDQPIIASKFKPYDPDERGASAPSDVDQGAEPEDDMEDEDNVDDMDERTLHIAARRLARRARAARG